MSHQDTEKPVERPDINAMFTLKVDNIPFDTTKETLDEEFSKFGKIGDIYIPRALHGRRGNRGYAFVRFMERDRMEDAQRALDGKMLDGKEMKILEAKEKRPDNPKQHMLDKGYGRHNNRRRSRSRSRDRRGYRGDYDDRRRGDYDDRRRGDYDDRRRGDYDDRGYGASRQNNNYRRRSSSRSRDRYDDRRRDHDRRGNSNDRNRSDRRSRDRSRDRD